MKTNENKMRRGLLTLILLIWAFLTPGSSLEGVASSACFASSTSSTSFTSFTSSTSPVRAEAYRIEVAFSPAEGKLQAKVSLDLRAVEPMRAMELELARSLEIHSVETMEGQKLRFERSRLALSPKLLVDLDKPAAAGDKITLVFRYGGKIRGGLLDFVRSDGILLRDDARWYPAVDLAAFTQLETRITVPAGWEAVSSGNLVSREEHGKQVTFVWQAGSAVSSRSVAAGPYREQRLRQGAITYAIHLPGQHAERSSWLLGRARRILEFYAARFAPYPHASFSLLEAPIESHGAAGYAAAGFSAISPEGVEFDGAALYSPEFLPHELAHQWFPNEVTLAGAEDGWLAEGLAQYAALLYLRETDPPQAKLLVERSHLGALAVDPLRPISAGLKLFSTDGASIADATLYQRGLLVFTTLETVIGRSRVEQALREYYARYRGRAASIADFEKICEEVSHRELKWFFDYYIRGTGIPTISLDVLANSPPGEFQATIRIADVPENFSVRVDLPLVTSTEKIDHSVATIGSATPFTITYSGTRPTIDLDPELKILRWTDAARVNRAVSKRMGRADDLLQEGKAANAQAELEKAAQLDPENVSGSLGWVFLRLGRIGLRQGRIPAARNFLRRAGETSSSDPLADAGVGLWSQISLAQLEEKLGRKAAARRIFRSLRGTTPAFLLRSRLDFEGPSGPTAGEVIAVGLGKLAIQPVRH